MSETQPLIDREISGYVETSNVALVDGSATRYTPLRVECRYHNDTGDVVTFIDRRGVPYTVPSLQYKDDLIRVQLIYEYANTVSLDTMGEFCETPNVNAEIKLLKEVVTSLKRSPYSPGNNVFIVEYRFSAEAIRLKGGSIYTPELDLVINVGAVDRNRPLHPFSLPDVRLDLLHSDMDVNNRDKFSASVYIVSNEIDMNGRYINVMGEVFYVPCIKSKTMRDGVYVTHKSTADNKNIKGKPVCKIIPLNELESLEWLYKTREEALHKNHVEVKSELALSQTKLQIKQQEQENEIEKVALDRVAREAKAKADYESMIRKDHYEMKSLSRKDTSEAFKATPIIIGGVLTLAGLYFKFKS